MYTYIFLTQYVTSNTLFFSDFQINHTTARHSCSKTYCNNVVPAYILVDAGLYATLVFSISDSSHYKASVRLKVYLHLYTVIIYIITSKFSQLQ